MGYYNSIAKITVSNGTIMRSHSRTSISRKQLYMKTVQNEDVAPPPSFAASKEAAAKAKTKRSAKTKGAAPPPPQSKALVAARTASKRNGDDSSPTAAKAKVSRSGRVLKPRLQSWEGERIVYDAYGNPIGAHATVIATSSSTSTTSTRRSSLNKLVGLGELTN